MKIGIFGGTFDPLHLGHLHLAERALEKFMLNRILWVITPSPPHKAKTTITDIKHRMDMVAKAIAHEARFVLSRVDIDRSPPHYAVDTLGILKRKYSEAELYYLIGGDSLMNFPLWHKPSEVVAHCTKLGVYRRSRSSIDLDKLNSKIPGIKDKILYIDSIAMDISASDIRSRIISNDPFEHLIPKSVYKIITARKLYKE